MRIDELQKVLLGLPADAPVQLYVEWSRTEPCEECGRAVSVQLADYFEVSAALAEPAYDGERGACPSLTLLAGPIVK